MQTLRVIPDQWTAIGQSLAFAVTDIDPEGVRILLRGQIIGGPDDGERINRAIEIAVGSEARIGIIVLTLIDTKQSKTGGTAKLGVFCPPHMGIRPAKEPT